jgi:cardiolipin synthase
MLQFINLHFTELVSTLWTITATLTTFHIVLYKRETKSAIGWIGLSWLTPVIGSVFYLLFGINRIERRAESLRRGLEEYQAPESVEPVPADEVAQRLMDDFHHLGSLARLVDDVVKRPLLPGNDISPLINGEEAYPAMIEAIEQAEESVSFSTYIFDNDEWGRRFVEALGDAAHRGVEVRVLVDAAGLRYSFPSVFRRLRKAGVTTAKFLPSLLPPHLMSVNLRNHRKIMVVDGRIGYTGGMNIRNGHVVADEPEDPVQDIHFRLEGPVVAHLQEVFVDDWKFSTGEDLRGEIWFPELERVGDVMARGIPDGPDKDLEKLPWTLHGAIACARESVRIVTPYFLPDDALAAALNTAALRDVEVDIILPVENNLPFVQWATFGQIRPLLERGCRVWMTPPPFDHSKVAVVDERWSLVGSANWDPRSLRLNFEFNVECYDYQLADYLDSWALEKRSRAERLTLEAFDNRPFLHVLRDNVARLAAPYL